MKRLSRFLRLCVVGSWISVLSTFVPAAQAQDYEREARWRTEVEPTILVGDPVDLTVGDRKVFALFTEGKDKNVAVVLVHGIGVHPDFGFIGKARTLIAERGYSTLSVQMPVLAKEITDPYQYVPLFPEAHRRLDAAAAWLKQRGYSKLVLAGHSMGAWMTNTYLENVEKSPFLAWVCISITGRIGSTGNFSGPILDLTAENDFNTVLRAAWLRRIKLWGHAGSETVVIPKTNHFFENGELPASEAIVKFVARVTQ